MREVFLKFGEQFAYQAKIENIKKYKKAKKFIVLGMGGSHLAADVIKSYLPELGLTIHKRYGLPAMSNCQLREHLIIANSYSGNTEEVIEGLRIAHAKKMNVMVIAVGGKMIKFAQKNKLPYIQLPNMGIQPRTALGYSIKAMLKAMGQKKALDDFAKLTKTLSGKKYESTGKALAKKLKGQVPIIYSSEANLALAYNWKIKLNETGKIPAFYNILPELNHNEMNGFDVAPSTKKLSQNFHFVFIRDSKDHKQVQKRLAVLEKLYKKRKLPVTNIKLEGKGRAYQLFSNLVIADWLSYYTAQSYGLEAEQVPMVEEFKKMI